MAYFYPAYPDAIIQEDLNYLVPLGSTISRPNPKSQPSGSLSWNPTTKDFDYFPASPPPFIPLPFTKHPFVAISSHESEFSRTVTPPTPALSATSSSSLLSPASPLSLPLPRFDESWSPQRRNEYPTIVETNSISSGIGPARSLYAQARAEKRRGVSPIAIRYPTYQHSNTALSYPRVEFLSQTDPAGLGVYDNTFGLNLGPGVMQGIYYGNGLPSAPTQPRLPISNPYQGPINFEHRPVAGSSSLLLGLPPTIHGFPPLTPQQSRSHPIQNISLENDGLEFVLVDPIAQSDVNNQGLEGRFCLVGDCVDFFQSKKDCIRHRETVHWNPQAWICPNPHCKAANPTYSRKDALWRHMQTSAAATCGTFARPTDPDTSHMVPLDQRGTVAYNPLIHVMPTHNSRSRRSRRR